MRTFTFAKRNLKEITRDPLNLAFIFGFPIVLLLLLSAIQMNIPVKLFEIERLAPGITVFGLSFITLFSATTISKDRSSSFLQRLYTTPLTSFDFILGYTLPILPIAVIQCIVTYLLAMIIGLNFTVNILLAVVFIVPISIIYIAIGLLCGSVFNEKQVGGFCGALLTNLSAWVSGIWFDLELVGGIFKKVSYVLPFVHAVELERKILAGDFSNTINHLLWVLGYSIVILCFAIFIFLKQMKKQ